MVSALTLLLMASAATQQELTIYNQGFALVKEVRQLDLKSGRQTVAVADVAERIEPTTVSIKSLDSGHDIDVLEQNYQYDLISVAAILNKSVGQKIRLIRHFGATREVIEGTLLSAPTAVIAGPEGQQTSYQGMVVRSDDGEIILDPVGEVRVKEVPEGLISRPTLLWDLESPKAGKPNVELSYLTQGMSWASDYVLTLDGVGAGDLQGWVTLNNQSGATFRDAKLKLLAGDVQRVQEFNQPPGRGGAVLEMRAMAKDNFQEESLFEYHLYTLQRPATVKNRETKQISLLEAKKVPVTKKLILDSLQGMGRYFPGEGEIGTGTNLKPQVRIEFTNDEKSGLGMPLPQGKVRVYQRDKSGSVQMLGEDKIDHTPKNEKLSLVVGRSFDVVASRRRTLFERISDRSVRESFEIEVRNRKDVPETVHVIERHWGDWRVTAKSQDFVKLDSNTMQFVVTLKANETRKVTYTVETRW